MEETSNEEIAQGGDVGRSFLAKGKTEKRAVTERGLGRELGGAKRGGKHLREIGKIWEETAKTKKTKK